MTMNNCREVIVRPATKSDGEALVSLVAGLADYEKFSPPDAAACERLIDDAFGADKRFDVLIAEIDDKAIGYALFFETYSTFLARPKLYLEDLFVDPNYRGLGAGEILFNACLSEARRRGCARMEWLVLDWNEPAIKFYQRRNAKPEDSWKIYNIDIGPES